MFSLASLTPNLTSKTIGLSALALFFTWYILSSLLAWHRLRHIPGPWTAKFSYLWLARLVLSGQQADRLRTLHSEHGGAPLLRIGPNMVVTDDPDAIRLASGAREPWRRDGWYSAARLNPYHDTMFSMLDPATHDRFKAKTAGGYSGREGAALLEAGVDAVIAMLVELLRTKYVAAEHDGALPPVLDFARVASFFTLDVITRAGFGEEFGCLRTDSDVHGYLETTTPIWAVMTLACNVPWLRSIVFSPTLLKFVGPTKKDEKGVGKLMRVAEELVAKRFEPGAKPTRDMMGSFMNHGMTALECECECLFMIVAGSDTTSSTIRMAMLHLITSPRIYNRLKEVIREAVQSGNASSPINIEEAKRIPYLQAFIYESIRIRSAAPNLLPKIVPPQGETICGTFIPGGTSLAMNTQSLLRCRKTFGPDADMFRPERFMEAEREGRRIEMEKQVELAFGYGRWMCAGKPVAMMELSKVFFELLRYFDFQLVNPIHPMESASYIVFIEDFMYVRVTSTDMNDGLENSKE